MWLTGEPTIADTSVKTVNIVHAAAGSLSIGIADKWSLVSLPVIPADSSVSVLFPDALPHAFSFGTEYAEEEFLTAGSGYRVKNDGAGLIDLTGVPFHRNVVTNGGGAWLLLGSVYCPIPRSAACPSCLAPPVIYGYRNGYYIPDTLFPGEAYWYRGMNTLDLDCSLAGQAAAQAPGRARRSRPTGWKSRRDRSADHPPFRPDAAGRSHRRPLPASARPSGLSFDARFETENSVEYFEGMVDADRPAIGIRVANGGGGTLIRSARGISRHRTVFRSSSRNRRGRVRRHPLRQDMSIDAAPGTTIRLLMTGTGATPGTFRVYGNYPNPFNPRTITPSKPAWEALSQV